jgi:hypothetical protein
LRNSPLRIAFDLDGVLADLGSELTRQAEALFGETASAGLPQPSPSSEGNGEEDETTAPDALPVVPLTLSRGRLRRLWKHVQAIENFWETLAETEPGIVQRLATIAEAERWEVIFLTKRPPSAGATAQVQTQRWLQAKGFLLPSVFVVQGSRGRVAAALALDVVVDDRPENCLDVIADSSARAMLVWRGAEQGRMRHSTHRLGIPVVTTVGECLELLSHGGALPEGRHGIVERVRRALGLLRPPPAS